MALLVVVELRQSGVKLRLEGIQIHLVGIEHVFIHHFLVVPASGYFYAVSVCLLYQFAAPVDVVSGAIIADAVGIAVIRPVHLLHLRPRPAGIPFRIAEYLLGLCVVRIESGIGSVEARPLSAVNDAVVVRGRRIVAQGFRAGIPAVNVPPLGVVLPGRFFQVVAYPRSQVVVAGLEQVGHSLRSSDHREQRIAHGMFHMSVQVVSIPGHSCNVAYLPVQQVMKTAPAQNGIREIVRPGLCQSHPHVIQVVNVRFQVFLGEIVLYIAQIIEEGFPVDAAAFRQFEQRGKLRGNLQEHHVPERQRAIGHYRFKLHTEGLYLGADFHQVTAPIQGSLRGMEHLTCHCPYLRHYLRTYEVVNAAIIVVLRAVAPDAQVGKSLAVEELRQEYARRRHFRRAVFVEYVLYLLGVIGFGSRFGGVSRRHCRHGLLVVVDTHILCFRRKDGNTHAQQQDKDFFHGLRLGILRIHDVACGMGGIFTLPGLRLTVKAE